MFVCVVYRSIDFVLFSRELLSANRILTAPITEIQSAEVLKPIRHPVGRQKEARYRKFIKDVDIKIMHVVVLGLKTTPLDPQITKHLHG